ncbi:MAG: flavin-dependent monooxygenase, partial [Rhodospirillaceae bacterium]|nr:flavin-dependent monooxygenase [Rhodospirillaceae bacterium]
MDAAISDPAQLLESARALYPKLRERASQVEAARKISSDSFQEMKEAGLFRMTQPKAYGGAQLPYHVFCEAVMEIAQGCPSTGWIYAV